MEAIIIVAIIISVLALSAYFWEGNAPKPYNERSCTGRKWGNEFPDVHKEVIKNFLECFVDGMAFGSKERLKFNPSDEVMKAYQSIYGDKTPLADAMELETFYLNLTREFKVSSEYLEQVWNEHLTLGELFSHIIAQQDTPSDPKTATRFSVGCFLALGCHR